MSSVKEPVVDLNADLGESYGTWRLGDDEAMLALVTSANAACGFHAGDPLTIRRACAAAVARGVSIGAQVSYHDLPGFGRREMTLPPDELSAEMLYQIAALDGIASAEGSRVSYVKPHGALYGRAGWDPGPRDDWFDPAALAALASGTFEVTPASNRTGLRLAGPPLRRARTGELPSEGMVTGALQVPGDGQPILLLADHPATGGYPVLAVVATADIGRAAQLRPGQRVRFVLSG